MQIKESNKYPADIMFLNEKGISVRATYMKPTEVGFEIDFTPELLEELNNNDYSMIRDNQGNVWHACFNWDGDKLLLERKADQALLIVDIQKKYEELKDTLDHTENHNNYWEWFDFYHPAE